MHWLERWLLPPICVLSGQKTSQRDIADSIVARWAIPSDVCPTCCEPSLDAKLCGACIVNPPAFTRTQVGFYFDQELRELIYGLKYQNKLEYARILGELLAEKLDITGVEAIVAVPLFKTRFRDRGYNQAELIAESLAEILNIPLLKNAVIRRKDTPSQTHLTANQRNKNLHNAFQIQPKKFEGLTHIAIIDDVITTGSTMQSLAKKLQQETELALVQAWAVAKTK